MKPAPFHYHAPTSLDQALGLLAELGSDAKVLAGGQSLVPVLNMRLASPANLVDINRLPGLDLIDVSDHTVRVGALVRQRQVERSVPVAETCPLLVEALSFVSHPVIRNRGTVVGSVAHGDPAAEIPTVLAVLEGSVIAASASGRREIPATEFFLGPFETALRADEMAVEARFPAPSGAGVAFKEVARRHGDYALCGVAAVVGTVQARVAFTGVGPTPHVADVAGPLEQGVEAAARAAVVGVDPQDDIHATADFRRHLALVLVRRTLARALACRDEAGPASTGNGPTPNPQEAT